MSRTGGAVPGGSVRADGIVVSIGGRRLLDEVSLEVAVGSWLSIVGPNGAGKTTLLSALAGLRATAAGTIIIDGRPLGSWSRRDLARRIAIVPQGPVLPPSLRVSDYVLLGRTPHLGRFSSEGPTDLVVAARALEQLDLVPLGGRTLGTLSGGERQRVVIARALAQEAPVLLLDEPTAGLDAGHQLEVLELVDQLRCAIGLTVISTMHELTLAGQFAQSMLLLDRGRVMARGTPEEVLTDDHLARFYGASVRVIEADGARLVVPLRARRDDPARLAEPAG